MLHINKGRGHIFEKVKDSCNDYCISIAWDWCFVGWSDEGIEAKMAHIAQVCKVTDPEEKNKKVIDRNNNTIHAMLLHARKIIEKKDMEISSKEKKVSEACAKNIDIFVKREEKNLSETHCGGKKIIKEIGPLSGKQHVFGTEKDENSLFEKDCDHRCMDCFIELYNSFLYCQNCEEDHKNQLCYICFKKRTMPWCHCKTIEKVKPCRCIRTLELEEIKKLKRKTKDLKI